MAAPHQAGALTRNQQRPHTLERCMCSGRQGSQLRQEEQVRLGGQLGFVLGDDVVECLVEICVRHRWRNAVRGGDSAAECIGEGVIDAVILGKMVEGLVFVEAAHFHRPFDRFTFAADGKMTISIAINRDNAAVDPRSESAVDGKFGLASPFAFLKSRKIEERKPHRTFDLDRTVAGQKYGRGMGIDTLDRCPAMAGRIAEEIDDGLLFFGAHAAVFQPS